MNADALKQLIDHLPDGETKMNLLSRFEQWKSKQDENTGFSDVFEFRPTGAIKIEAIRENEEPELILEKQNLVVKGSEEILLKAFSGDPANLLYKIRTPKISLETATQAVLGKRISPAYSFSTTENLFSTGTRSVIIHDPQKYWNCVNDEDFDISYSYTPTAVVIREEQTSIIPGKKAFRIYDVAETGVLSSDIVLQPEIYSTHSNFFIAIGDGISKSRSLSLNAFEYGGAWTAIDTDGSKSTTFITSSVTFAQKCNYVKLTFLEQENGGIATIFVDGVVNQTIDTSEASILVLDNLQNGNTEKETTIRIEFTGKKNTITDPLVTLKAIESDFLLPSDNFLFSELRDTELNYEIPTGFKTTITPPYKTNLNKKDIIPSSLVITIGDVTYEPVATKAEVTEGTYYLDALSGDVYFNRTLTGILASFSITGKEHISFNSESTIPYFMYNKAVNKTIATTIIYSTSTKSFVSHTLNAATSKYDYDLLNVIDTTKPYTVKLKKADGTTSKTIATGSITITSVSYKSTLSIASAEVTGISSDDTIEVIYTKKTDAYVLTFANAISSSFSPVGLCNNAELSVVASDDMFDHGCIKLSSNPKSLLISKFTPTGALIQQADLYVMFNPIAGWKTNYKRSIIDRNKKENYPWYELDRGTVTFVAEFKEQSPNYNTYIREMMLVNGPRTTDGVNAYNGHALKAFSIVRVPELIKDATTAIRITWTITLKNNLNEPFSGGF